MPADTPTIRLADYQPPAFTIDSVSLDFQLDRDDTLVTNTMVMQRDATNPGGPLQLDGDGLELVSLALDDTPMDPSAFTASPERLEIIGLPESGAFTLTIQTRVDPVANTQLKGLYSSSGVYCTQCEAEGFRRMTYFLDRPDVMTIYTTRLEAVKSEAPVLLSNGNLVEAGDVPGTNRHFAVWHDPHKKPSYLFALVGGALDVLSDEFITMSGRKVDLKIYCEPGKADRCHYAMDALKRSMRWDEEEFGCEYDLDIFMIVAVSDFTMGAMENKGLNIFNDKYILADAETATDVDFANIEGIVAHEYFHNWTGNRITCRDWFQLCLKEGLTVFRDQEFSSDMRSRPVERIANVNRLRSSQFPEDAGPLAHPVRPTEYKEIDNFYTATVYQKGSELIRMLKVIIGPADFDAGMRLYLSRHDGEATTIEKFLDCFQDTTSKDLTQFAQWYHQAGTPVVQVKQDYDAASGTLTLTLNQHTRPTPGQSVKQPLHIPIELGLIGANGDELAPDSVSGGKFEDGVLHLTDAQQTVTFSGLGQRPVLSAFRQFSAPVICKSDQTDADLEFLMTHDSDHFNRWQAKQTLALRHLVAATRAIGDNSSPSNTTAIVAALTSALNDASLDAMFKSQLLSLPAVSDVISELGREVDPNAIHQAIVTVKADLIASLGGTLDYALTQVPIAATFSPDAAQAGYRALRAGLLDLIACRGTSADDILVQDSFNEASNMTDKLAALRAAVHNGLPCADGLLDAFFQTHKDDAIVLDKWLSLQATVAQAETVDRVRALTAHDRFTFKVPNRVYALIGALLLANPVAFHRADGAGYQFAAEMVGRLDPINGQLAARLLTSFRTWKLMDAERRKLAEAALQSLDTGTLSRDAGEILEKMLG